MNRNTIVILISIFLVVVAGVSIFASKAPSTGTPATESSTPFVPRTLTNEAAATLPPQPVVEVPSAAQNTVKPVEGNDIAPAQGEIPAGQASAPVFTKALVAQHNTAQSCYTIVNGVVYDLTSWIKQHPGGSGAILRMCGVDGTAGFMNQHGGQGRPEAELAKYQIGTL